MLKKFLPYAMCFGLAFSMAVLNTAAEAQNGLGVTQSKSSPPLNGVVTGPLGQDFYAGGNLVMSTRAAGVEFTRHVMSDFIYYAPSWAAGYARTLEEKLFDNVSLKDFGGGSGEDDAPLIGKALAVTPHIFIPCGTYNLNSSIGEISVDGATLQGAGMSCVTINVNYTISSGNILELSGHYQSVKDITFNSSFSQTGGNLFYANNTFGDNFSNIATTGPFFNVIYLYGANNTSIKGVYGRPPFIGTIPDPQDGQAFAGGAFITLDGNGSSQAVDTYLSGLNVAQYRNSLLLLNASGIYADSSDFMAGENSIKFDPPSGEDISGFYGVNILSDTSYSDNWIFMGDGGIFEVMCSNCWGSSSYSGAGFNFSAKNSSQINFSNSTSINNSKHGLYIIDGKNISWTGGAIEMNNTQLGSTGDVPDVLIANPDSTLDWIRISETFIGQGGVMKYWVGKNNKATYAVDCAGLTSDVHLTMIGIQSFNHIDGVFNLPSDTSNITSTAITGN